MNPVLPASCGGASRTDHRVEAAFRRGGGSATAVPVNAGSASVPGATAADRIGALGEGSAACVLDPMIPLRWSALGPPPRRRATAPRSPGTAGSRALRPAAAAPPECCGRNYPAQAVGLQAARCPESSYLPVSTSRFARSTTRRRSWRAAGLDPDVRWSSACRAWCPVGPTSSSTRSCPMQPRSAGRRTARLERGPGGASGSDGPGAPPASRGADVFAMCCRERWGGLEPRASGSCSRNRRMRVPPSGAKRIARSRRRRGTRIRHRAERRARRMPHPATLPKRGAEPDGRGPDAVTQFRTSVGDQLRAAAGAGGAAGSGVNPRCRVRINQSKGGRSGSQWSWATVGLFTIAAARCVVMARSIRSSASVYLSRRSCGSRLATRCSHDGAW